MKNNHTALMLSCSALMLFSACTQKNDDLANDAVLLRNATVISGLSNTPQTQADVLIKGDTIAAIGQHLDTTGVQVINLEGKTIMPALISAHVHIGLLKGTATKPENYTRENILNQLNKYARYGVLNIMVMGTDRPFLFESGLRDSSAAGKLPGARIHTAGYGFGVAQGAPPVEMGMDGVYRPTDVKQIPAQMDSLAKVNPEAVKIWVDDFGGKFKKMPPEIYQSIIAEAHKHKLRVAAHAYYVADARKLVAAGVDIIGHSIRDSVVDDGLVEQMKVKGIAYIPTLSLDEFAYIYARQPEWLNDGFFKASLEPGVYDMITSAKYREDLKNSPAYARNVHAFETALKNLKKLHNAGILVALGTDSGAMPLRAQGFSEHLEMQLMVEAGLTPQQAITAATASAAKLLKIDARFGSIEKGKVADLLILDANPLTDIKNTRKIYAVYKDGKQVNKGSLSK